MNLFYKPEDAWLGDVIPFSWQGAYHIFYLHDPRNPDCPVPDTDWYHLSTQDFLSYQQHDLALPRGSTDERDLAVYTGSICEKDGVFHLYYTGHNHHRHGRGEISQVIMRAQSTDLRTWNKDADFVLEPELSRYEMDDWRDPLVFWNADAGQYWMLIVARRRDGPAHRRGCIARAVSQDFTTWQLDEPFWSPNQFYNLECPDLLRIGDWWYLIFSTFNSGYGTRYRRSRRLDGPWIAPAHDFLDGRGFYAAKTFSCDERHFLAGWLATREGETDSGKWEWGGNLVIHELVQDEAGALQARMPRELESALKAKARNRQNSPRDLTLESGDKFVWERIGSLPQAAYIEVELKIYAGTRECGLFLRADKKAESYYQLRLEPQRQRLVFDRWPKASDGPFWPRDNDPSFVIERPLDLDLPDSVRLQLVIQGDCMVVYANETVALSTRIYDLTGDNWGAFVSDGAATFSVSACAPLD